MAKREKKEDVNVSIKHYLNTKLKPDVPILFTSTGSYERYPLYVQIVVRGQTFRIRSLLREYVSIQEFDDFLEKYASDIEKEKYILTRTVKDKIVKGPEKIVWNSSSYIGPVYELDQLIENELARRVGDLLQKLFVDIMVPLTKIWKRAKYNDQPKVILSEHEMRNKSFINNINNNDSPFSFFRMPFNSQIRYKLPLREPGDANTFSLFFSAFIEEFEELRNAFEDEFWDLHTYVHKVKKEQDIRIITIDDWFSGEFDRLFIMTWKDEKALMLIHKSFDKMRATSDSNLKAFLDLYDPSLMIPFVTE